MADPHQVTHLHYSRSKRRLALTFADGADYQLSAEFLRVFSPSAEVRGHGPGPVSYTHLRAHETDS